MHSCIDRSKIFPGGSDLKETRNDEDSFLTASPAPLTPQRVRGEDVRQESVGVQEPQRAEAESAASGERASD